MIYSASVADLDPGFRCLFDPWIRDPEWVKNQDPDPDMMNNLDHISESLEPIFWVKILNSLMRIRDNKKIRIRIHVLRLVLTKKF
jgi:hypothetical protein